MRGTQSFNTSFVDIGPELKNSGESIGRSKELINKRNEQLVARYYYYGTFSKKRYDEILLLLKDEFHLAVCTIMKRIEELQPQIKELRDKKPKLIWFRNRWPHIRW